MVDEASDEYSLRVYTPSGSCVHEAEWTLFQTQYFSENLVAPGIEPGPLNL
jgi:hypothetical protein